MRKWISAIVPYAVSPQKLFGADAGLLGQGVRFVLVGGVTALIALLTTSLLALVVGIPFQIALTIGYLPAIAFHFTMQRVFVWANRDGFTLPFRHQASRYFLLVATQYGLTSASIALLPGVLGLPTEIVYVATVVLLALASFMVLRHRVFHPKAPFAHPDGETSLSG